MVGAPKPNCRCHFRQHFLFLHIRNAFCPLRHLHKLYFLQPYPFNLQKVTVLENKNRRNLLVIFMTYLQEWQISLKYSDDENHDFTCAVYRPGGMSYLFFLQFKLAVKGAHIEEVEVYVSIMHAVFIYKMSYLDMPDFFLTQKPKYMNFS